MRILFFRLCLICFVAVAGPASADIEKPADLNETLDLLLERLQPEFPDARINRRDRNIAVDAAGDNIVNPDNIHAMLNTIEDAGEREAALDSFVGTMIASINEPARDPADLPLDRVYPVVRHQSFAQAAGAEELYFEPFVGDMIRVYAIDYPDRVAYVTRANLTDADVSAGALDASAMLNLADKFEGAQFDGNGVSYMILLDGFYESSLVLDGALWTNLAAQFQDEIVMIVPARDLLVFAPLNATEEVKFLDGLRADVLANGTHQLSDFMYVWRNGRWQVFTL